METGLLHDYLGIFFIMRGREYYFHMERRLNPHKVRLNIEMNIPAGGEHGPDGRAGEWGQSRGEGHVGLEWEAEGIGGM